MMKMIRKISVLLAVVMLIGSMGLTALAGSYLGDLRVVNCDEWVTLRASPSTKAASLCKVPLGAVVEGYYYNTEFTECYYNGMWGYILSSYLASYSTPVVYSDYLGTKQVINCNEWVTLRSAPSTSASAVTRVPKGQYVEAYYYNGEFSRCYYNGMTGYILSYYLGSVRNYIDINLNGDYMGDAYVVNCDEWVSLRSLPSTSASRILKVPLGAVVDAYYYNSTFSYCYYNGCWGYILNDYLAIAGYTCAHYSRVVNCDEWVSLRSYPSTSASRLCQVPLGAIVESYYYNSEFSECYYNGMWGYILNEYLAG